jgi:AcrR family transcriptional regulator
VSLFGSKEELFRQAVEPYGRTVGTAAMQALEEPATARLDRGVAQGNLPAGLDLPALASFHAAVLNDLPTQARNRASRDMLMAAIHRALAAWDTLVAERN